MNTNSLVWARCAATPAAFLVALAGLAGCANGPAATDDGCEPVIVLTSAADFPDFAVDGFAPAYLDKRNEVLAINAAQYKDQSAAAQTTFAGCTGVYDVTFTTLTEIDGESTYRVTAAGRLLGRHTNPETDTDYAPSTATWIGARVAEGDIIQVEFNSHTNGKIPEGDGTAYARGRWVSLSFSAVEGDNAIR